MLAQHETLPYTRPSSIESRLHSTSLSLWGSGTLRPTMRIAPLCLVLAAATAGCASTSGAPVSTSAAVSAAVAAPLAVEAVSLTWTSRIIQFSREAGKQFVFDCPRGGRAERVTGTDTYGETSSVCTAAVHAGLVTLADGGRVRVEVRPGRETFSGSSRNGITTVSYGRMTNSFVFLR